MDIGGKLVGCMRGDQCEEDEPSIDVRMNNVLNRSERSNIHFHIDEIAECIILLNDRLETLEKRLEV